MDALRSREETIRELGPWFHNLHLPGGVQTAPDHFLGDYPSFKWQQVAPHLPEDLTGASALDVGCNAGYYSFELARRGAEVLAIDHDPHYLRQARWAASQLDLHGRVQFQEMQVYDIGRLGRTFDVVLFMGVFYHLRHPLLALELVAAAVGDLLVFQTLTMPGEDVFETQEDYGIDEREVLRTPGWPVMAFVERKFAGDPTNWWIPNGACVEALLRSTGLPAFERPGHEIWLCRRSRG